MRKLICRCIGHSLIKLGSYGRFGNRPEIGSYTRYKFYCQRCEKTLDKDVLDRAA